MTAYLMAKEKKDMSEIRDFKARFGSPESFRVYAGCMYRPTAERFTQVANDLKNRRGVSIFACLDAGKVQGIIAVEEAGRKTAVILGIAVDAAFRRNGIGRRLIAGTAARLDLGMLTAETDDDAVCFYRRCGFQTVTFEKTFGHEVCRRYRCTLRLR